MNRVILLLACLGIVGYGRRVQTSMERLQSSSSTMKSKAKPTALVRLQNLAKLIVASVPQDAFMPSSLGGKSLFARPLAQPPVNRRSPMIVAQEAAVEEAEERRIDMGGAFTMQEFKDYYQDEWEEKWNNAEVEEPAGPMELEELSADEDYGEEIERSYKFQLGKVNMMHNDVQQALGVTTEYTYEEEGDGHKATLTWNYWEGEDSKTATSEGKGKTQKEAKSKANEAMLIKMGHLPEFGSEFWQKVRVIKEALDNDNLEEATITSLDLMETSKETAYGYLFFLPEVLRALLAEGDNEAIHRLVQTARDACEEKGTPVDLWEALLDEASYTLRHFESSMAALLSLGGFPLAQGSFPSDKELQYFQKYRLLLAHEKHGALQHGIQQYELDPKKFVSVPLMQVEFAEGDRAVLIADTSMGMAERGEGARDLQKGDVALFIPNEAVGVSMSSQWQHPEAWVGSVISILGNPRDGEDLKVNIRQVSKFTHEALKITEGENPIYRGRQYKVFLLSMETPTTRMLSALRGLCRVQLPAFSDSFEKTFKYQFTDGLRNIILASVDEATEKPEGFKDVDSEVVLNKVTEDENFAGLTPSQREAVTRALDERISLIQGPPGTGKTHAACAIMWAWQTRAEVMGGDYPRILAVADSNVAADNLYERLESFGIEAYRIGNAKRVESVSGDDLYWAAENAMVVIATCIGAGMEILRDYEVHFPLVIVDECTQACEPTALVALGRYAEQAVFIGDQNQLPATVLSRKAQDEGLGVSLFERLLNSGLQPTLLKEQWRMHSSIADFPNSCWYDGKLINLVKDEDLAPVEGFAWPNPDIRVAFVDVSGDEGRYGFSTYNSAEAEALADVVKGLIDAGTPAEDLGVLTAYQAQRDELKRAISDRRLWDYYISIDTIDGYQGMQCEIVLFSAARSNAENFIGFLADPRRMNVMLTRARRGVIVFGNAEALENSGNLQSRWRYWLDWVRENNAFTTAAELALATEYNVNEKRRDPNDGGEYTRDEFKEYYGQNWYQYWGNAEDPNAPVDGDGDADGDGDMDGDMDGDGDAEGNAEGDGEGGESEEKRMDEGGAFTMQEFKDYYQDAWEEKWNNAEPAEAPVR